MDRHYKIGAIALALALALPCPALAASPGDDGGPINGPADPIDGPADPIKGPANPIRKGTPPTESKAMQKANSLGITQSSNEQPSDKIVILGPNFQTQINGRQVEITGHDACGVESSTQSSQSDCVRLPINGESQKATLKTTRGEKTVPLRAYCASKVVTTPFQCKVVRVSIPGWNNKPGFYVAADTGEPLTEVQARRMNLYER